MILPAPLCHNSLRLSQAEFLSGRRNGAGSHDDSPARHFYLFTSVFNSNLETAHESSNILHFAIQMKLNIRMAFNTFDQAGNERVDLLVFKSIMQIEEITTQLTGLFHQNDLESLVGQGEGGRHAADTAADDQSGLE